METIGHAKKKGGQGNTITALAVASALGLMGKKVLFFDLDPQCNVTWSLLKGRTIQPDISNLKATVYDLLTDKTRDVEKVMRKTREQNVWIVPSSTCLDDERYDKKIYETPSYERLLHERRKEIEELGFDYVIFDSPPVNSRLKKLVMYASDRIVIPFDPSRYAYQGIHGLIDELIEVQQDLDKPIKVGVLITMMDRTRVKKQWAEAIRREFEGYVYQTEIRYSHMVRRSEDAAQSIIRYAPKDVASNDYISFIEEIIENE